ncbi:carbohydrate ABC transporter permease [Actinoallomurus iriomotensis]|uniref:ABC transporter permease n=1 Tax=Actinoallomurus iriomotensis TaxID=478107 RepID=A0A9W6RUX1_9ACTN|nr:carbohydrate ABC transporter permease [Actinoallomurus iriomotensis]GLY82158.1 ABC transporter permease [Actinoallomurus iriomotensis]
MASTRAAAGSGRRRGITFVVTAVVAVIVIFPVYWMIVGALLPTSITLSTDPPLIPTHGLTLHAFVQDLTARPVAHWMLNSLIVTAAVSVISMVISLLAGYSLSRFSGVGPTSVGYTLLLARMLPGTMLSIPLFVVFGKLGLIDSLGSLILADITITVPFTTWMLKSFIDSVPRELEQAAMIDGTTRLGALVRVVMPLTLPGLGATAVYAAILSWSDLLFARTLITNPDGWTMPVGVTSFIGAHDIDWSGMLAAGTLSMIPMIVLFVLLEPMLVRGLTSGATKG